MLPNDGTDDHLGPYLWLSVPSLGNNLSLRSLPFYSHLPLHGVPAGTSKIAGISPPL